MSIAFTPNTQNDVTTRSKRKRGTTALIGALLLTLSEIAFEVNSKNRKDTFVKTAKSCAKSYNKTRKEVVAGLCKYVLRNEDLAKKVFNIKNNNKKMFAAFLTVETLLNYLMFKMLPEKWFRDKKSQ